MMATPVETVVDIRVSMERAAETEAARVIRLAAIRARQLVAQQQNAPNPVSDR